MKKFLIGFYRKCDCLTMFGICMAFIAIILAMSDHGTVSAFCLMISGICDGFDGRLARKYKYSKDAQIYGIQMDSLADAFCFGAVPAILVLIASPFWWSKIICCFYLLSAIIRLAYFNTLDITKKSIKGVFIGVPSTTIAFIYPAIYFGLRLVNFELIKYFLPITLLLVGTSFILNIKIKKLDVNKIVKILNNKYVVNLILFPWLIIFLSELCFKLSLTLSFKVLFLAFNSIFHNFLAFLIIWILLDLIIIILTSIFNSTRVSKTIIFSLFIILMVISEIKFNVMGIPLKISDIDYLNPDNIQMISSAGSSLGNYIYGIIVKAIICILFTIGIWIIDKFHSYKFNNKKRRFVILGISILMLLVCYMIIYKTSFYKKISKPTSTYSVSEVYDSIGYIPGLFYDFNYNSKLMPDNYDKIDADKILKKYDDYNVSSWGKADVILLLSEAFTDINNLKEVTFTKDLLSNYHTLSQKKNVQTFNMYVPVNGGASVNTEWEILTGGQVRTFSPGYIPYNSYYNDYNGKMAPNIIKEFNNNDYYVEYYTTWGAASYRSQYVYNLVGADNTTYDIGLNSSSKKGTYYNDEEYINDLYNELTKQTDEKYKLIIGATAENHWKYEPNKYKKYDVKVERSSLSNYDTDVIKAYGQGVYDADKSIKQLYDMINKLKKHTIVVVFGDHIPLLNSSDGGNLYFTSSYIRDTSTPMESILHSYTTPVIIMANYDIDFDNIDFMSASYLGAYLVNKLDLNASNYFKFLNDTRNTLPVLERDFIYDNNIIPLNNLSKKQTDAYNNLNNVYYRMFYDFN